MSGQSARVDNPWGREKPGPRPGEITLYTPAGTPYYVKNGDKPEEKPKDPAPIAPPPPPTLGNADTPADPEVVAKVDAVQAEARKQAVKGRASTILTRPKQLLDSGGTTSRKVLLGS